MALGSLYVEAQGYVPVLLESLRGVLLWSLLALAWCFVSVSVWRRLMSSHQLVFPGVRSSLVFSGFHSDGHPEWFTESHGEEKREEGDRGGQEEKRGNQKERDPAGNQFPKCSPQLRTHKETHRVG